MPAVQERCARGPPFAHRSLKLKAECVSSQEIKLTEENISMLQRTVKTFKGADTTKRQKIIEGAVETIQRTWTGPEFDQETMMSVYDLSAKLCHPHIFLAR